MDGVAVPSLFECYKSRRLSAIYSLFDSGPECLDDLKVEMLESWMIAAREYSVVVEADGYSDFVVH